MGEHSTGRYPAAQNKFGRTISLCTAVSALYMSTVIFHEGADPYPPPLPGTSAEALSPSDVASDGLPLIDPAPGEHGPCFPDTSKDRRKLQIGAKACLAAYDRGEIALVNYGVPPRQAEKIAKDMATIIASSTSGLAHPSVTVLPASPDASRKLREMTSAQGCIDAITGSAVADATMPELKAKDFVVALNTLPSCQPLNGVARGWRRSDIFAYTADPALKAGRSSSDNPAARTGAHEWLHTVRIGHAGSLYSAPDKGDLSKKRIAQEPGSFDLKEYVTKSYVYAEYGERGLNPMSKSEELTVPMQAQLNPVQLEALRRPYKQLNNQRVSRAYLIGKNWTALHAAEARDAAFMTLSLSTSVTLKPTVKSKGYRDDLKLFDTLNLVPIVDERGEKSSMQGVRILLSNEKADTVDLGQIVLDAGEQIHPYQIKFGAQMIQLQRDAATVKARVVPVA